jgi:hypothetical protein
MSKPTTGSLAITAWRNDDYFEYPLRVVGLAATNLALAMEIRSSGDVPGPALVHLEKVENTSAETQGIHVAGVSIVDGVEVSDIRIRMDRGTLQELDYQGELGDAATFEYALLIGGRTRLTGPFILPAHAFGSDAAPAARPASYGIAQAASFPNGGATLTISADGGATVQIDGADLVSASIIRAEDAAEQTAADRDTVEGIASTSYQAVPTYAAREAIPLNKRQNGMRVQVMEGTPRVFEWRTDLYMPGAWVGQYTPAEIKNLGIDFTGQLASNQVTGLTDAQDAIDSIAAIDVAGFRATALSGDANPKVELAWEVKGTPTSQTISWGSSTIAIAAAARTFTPKDWAAVKPIFVVGNSLSTSTDTTNRWSQLLAADRKQPLYSVARYTSDWSQVYRSGAAPLYLTIAGGALPAGGTAAAVTLINGAAPTASPSANPASFLNTGDGGLTTGVSMAGTVVAGTTARHVTVSIPNAASTAYSIVQDAGAAALPLSGPVLFIPDIAKQIETSDLILWTGNNYYYSGVGNQYGDYTNPQMWVDMARIVAAAAGNRVLILPILPAADEPTDGTPNPNVPGEAYHLRSARAAANARTEALFPTAIARDAAGRTLLKRLQDSGNGSANDNADVAAGLTPRSLRSDALHLNAAGDAVVFAFVKEALARQALPSPVTQATVFTLTAMGANPRTGAEVRDTAYAVVRRGIVADLAQAIDGALTSSAYYPTLAEAVSDLGVGEYFNSDDQASTGPYPGVKWIYKRTGADPYYDAVRRWGDKADVGLGAYPDSPDALPVSEDQAAALNKRLLIDAPQELGDDRKRIGRANLGAIDQLVVDMVVGIEMAGAGDDAIDDSDALRATFARIVSGGKATGRVGARYRANNLTIGFGDDDIVVDYNSTLMRAPSGAYYDGLVVRGQMSAPLGVSIDTTSQPGKTIITWPGGIPAGFQVGDWIKVVSDDLIPARYGTTFSLRCGFMLCIQNFAGMTATCMGSPPYASAYVTNVRAARFPRGKVTVRDGTILGDPAQPGAPTDPIPLNHHLMVQNAVHAEVLAITVGDGPAPGVIAYNCVHAHITRPRGSNQGDLLGGAVGSLNSFCTVISGPVSAQTRHLADASANSVPAAQLGGSDLANYGLDYYCKIIGGFANGATTSGATFHEGAYKPIYENITLIQSDKVIGARGDQPTWSRLEADNCGVVCQVVRRTNSLRLFDSTFSNIRGQAMVSNQVNGVDQTLAGTSEIKRNTFHCNAVGFSRIFLPVVEEGALLDLDTNYWVYNASEGGKAFISPYGTGDIRLNEVFNFRDVPAGVTGLVPVRLSSASRSVRGKITVLLRTAAQASCLAAIVQMDATSAAYVDLQIDVECADGSKAVLNPLINNSQNTEQVYLSTNCGDSANYGFSKRPRRTGISTNDGRLIHNSRDAVFVQDVFPTVSVTGWTAQPGFERGQIMYVRNNSGSNSLFVFYGITIRPGVTWGFWWDGTTWLSLNVQIIGSRTWTPGNGSVPANSVVETVIAVTGAQVGQAARIEYSAALPTGLINLGGQSVGANTFSAKLWNPTNAAISTSNMTVTGERV